MARGDFCSRRRNSGGPTPWKGKRNQLSIQGSRKKLKYGAGLAASSLLQVQQLIAKVEVTF